MRKGDFPHISVYTGNQGTVSGLECAARACRSRAAPILSDLWVTEIAILDDVAAAVFSLKPAGALTAENKAALQLVGSRSGATTLIGMLDLSPAAGGKLDHCPLRAALEQLRERTLETFRARRADGSPCEVIISTVLRWDAAGRAEKVVATVSEVPPAQSSANDIDRALLAAIVESSSDAIISKSLDGAITTWNGSAQRIFGYTAAEIIGGSVMRIVPPELHAQEEEILERLRRGERVEPFDTVRIAKGGRRVDVSLTISPLRNAAGQVVGASKISRDITARKRAEALQERLFDELDHRVKNTLATLQSVAALSLSRMTDPASFVTSFTSRLNALRVAHELTVKGKMQGAELPELVQALAGEAADIAGPSIVLDQRLVVPLALALNELSSLDALPPGGRGWSVHWDLRDDAVLGLTWRAPVSDSADDALVLTGDVVKRVLASVDATIGLRSRDGWVEADFVLALPVDGIGLRREQAPGSVRSSIRSDDHAGRRVLIVEDEALIAMDMEAQLTSAGWEVVGPAGTIDEALTLIGATRLDAALVDANVRGRPVGEIAEALRDRNVPFVFASGYGRSALPQGFREARLLSKPFSTDDLLRTVKDLVREADLNLPARS